MTPAKGASHRYRRQRRAAPLRKLVPTIGKNIGLNLAEIEELLLRRPIDAGGEEIQPDKKNQKGKSKGKK